MVQGAVIGAVDCIIPGLVIGALACWELMDCKQDALDSYNDCVGGN